MNDMKGNCLVLESDVCCCWWIKLRYYSSFTYYFSVCVCVYGAQSKHGIHNEEEKHLSFRFMIAKRLTDWLVTCIFVVVSTFTCPTTNDRCVSPQTLVYFFFAHCLLIRSRNQHLKFINLPDLNRIHFGIYLFCFNCCYCYRCCFCYCCCC